MRITYSLIVFVLFCASSLFAQEVKPTVSQEKQDIQNTVSKESRLLSQLAVAYEQLASDYDGLESELSLISWKQQIYEAYILRMVYEERDELTVKEDRKLIFAFMQQDIRKFPDIAREAVKRNPQNALAQEILAFGLYGEGLSILGEEETLKSEKKPELAKAKYMLWVKKRDLARAKLSLALNLHLKNDAKIAAIMKTPEIEKKFEEKFGSGQRLTDEEYFGLATKDSYKRLKSVEGIPFDLGLQFFLSEETLALDLNYWIELNIRDSNKK